MIDNKECTKIEFVLSVNEFGESSSIRDIKALALNIHTLLLTRPGTSPNDMERGIGIQDYSFEILDDSTILNLRQSIYSQITKYIPNNLVVDVIVEKLSSSHSKENTLGVMFKFNKEDPLVLLFTKDSGTSNIMTKIIS